MFINKLNILKNFIVKGEQPSEGEERQFKDGRYKFENGKWNKIIIKKGEDKDLEQILYIEPFNINKVKPNLFNTHAEYEGGLQLKLKLSEEKKKTYNEIMHLLLNIRPLEKYWKKEEAFEKQQEFWKKYYPKEDKTLNNLNNYLFAINKLKETKQWYEMGSDKYQKAFAKQNLPLINIILKKHEESGLQPLFEKIKEAVKIEENKRNKKLREINDKFKIEEKKKETLSNFLGYGKENNWTGD